MMTKESDSELDAATIETSDDLPSPNERPIPDPAGAIQTALERRPELLAATQDLKNQDVTVNFTRNGLLPNISAFGLYAGAGLTGDTIQFTQGVGASLDQAFGASYPEYAAGLSATIPIRNRSAQADNMRARLEDQQLNVQLQRSRQRIGLEVRQAIIGLAQGRAQVEASQQAVRLAERIAQAEREKLELGVSTAYDVVLRDRDLLTARQNAVSATAAYAKALVDFDRATGRTLEENGIEMSDALAGQILNKPTPAMVR
jgi:outer membrane protein TolC